MCQYDIISFVSWCRLVLSLLVVGGLAGEECKCAIHKDKDKYKEKDKYKDNCVLVSSRPEPFG